MNCDLLKDPIKKLFIKFVIPSVIGMVVNALYIIVDGIFIGKGLGEVGLAAINLIYPVVYLNLAIGLLLGLGGTTLISIKIGEKNLIEAKNILANSIFFMILLGIILSFIGIIFLNPICIALGASNKTLKLAKDYGLIMFIFSTFHILSTGLNPLVRADNNPKLSMNILIFSSILNAILDWLFVIKFNLGMFGAALATVIGIFLSAVYLLHYFFSDNTNLRLHIKLFKPSLIIFKNLCKSGFVSFAMQIAMALILLMQNLLLLKYGSHIDVSILCIVLYIACIFFQIFLGIAQGIQPIIGYNHGAKNKDRIKDLMKMTNLVNLCFGILSFLIIYFLHNQLIYLYNENPNILKIGSIRLILFSVSLPIVGVLFTECAYYQSIKKDLLANVIFLSRYFLFLIPLSFILPVYVGVIGIFIAQPISDYLSLMLVFFIKYKFN